MKKLTIDDRNRKHDFGYSREISKQDDRQDKWKQQRKERGFDDTEMWSLDTTLAMFIAPRIRRFKEVNHGYPAFVSAEKWNRILDRMIFAFEFAANDPAGANDQKDWIRAEYGLKLFAKYYFHLWT